MKSHEEFEALVMKKMEAKRGGAVKTRRAWESVAATAVVCLLLVFVEYLIVPNGIGAPADTDPPVTSDSLIDDTGTPETTVPDAEKVEMNLASYMRYLPSYFHKAIEIHDGTVFREDISDLLVAFCSFEHERLDFVSYEEGEGVSVVTVKRDDLQKVGELLLGEDFDLADYRAYWGDPTSHPISRYDEAADCFTVEMGRDDWGGEPYYPAWGVEPAYRYDGNTVTVTLPISYQGDYYEGQRITFSYCFEKAERDGMIFYRLLSATAVPPTTLAPLSATWNGKTVTVKYDAIANIAFPEDWSSVYFCNGYAVFFDYGDDPDNWEFSEEGNVWCCMDINGNRMFSLVCDVMTNFDENGIAVAAFNTFGTGENEYYFINTKGEKIGPATEDDLRKWNDEYQIGGLPPEDLGLTVNPTYEESGEGFPCYFGDRGVWEYGTVWNGLVFMNFDDEGIVLMDTEGHTVLTTDYSFDPTHLGGLLLSEGRLVTSWNGYLAIMTVTVTDNEAAPDFDENRVTFYPDGPSITLDELIGGLQATACPTEDLPTVGAELTRAELEALLPFFRDTQVQAILAGDPFCVPEQIKLGWLLYYQCELTDISREEQEALGYTEEDPFLGTRLTASEFEAILKQYLGVEMTDDMLYAMPEEPHMDVRYLVDFDAYYVYHHDYNLMTPVLLQGWQTEDGGYLVRFLSVNGYPSGDEKDRYVLLEPVGDSYLVKQMLCLT